MRILAPCNIQWIESEGGPLVAVPSSKAALWRGVEGPDAEDACQFDTYAGVLVRPWGEAVVFDGEPMRTAVLPVAGSTAIVRWMYAPNESELVAAATAFDRHEHAREEQINVTLFDESYIVFDSASTADDTEFLTLPPLVGIRELSTYVVRGSEIAFVLHYFDP